VASGPHFIPEFARQRPIRAVLLAAAVFAIPYALARHQGDATGFPAAHVAPRVAPVAAVPPPAAAARPATAALPSVLPMIAVAMESVNSGASGTSWNPPIGLDRTNEALDRLTMDFTAGPQPPAPPAAQTSDHPSRFRTGARLSSPQSAGTAPGTAHGSPERGNRHPAPSVAAAAPAPATVEAALESPAASLPAEPDADSPASPAAAPAKSPATSRVAARAKPLAEIDQYLWSVYQRSSTKRDSSGDFTWKDEAAAARLGLVTKQYVIGGMDADFRTLLYGLGHAMDADGIRWTILSGFRDDYRQGLASGYKAHVGNSFHGGSRATGGYGHGCAADIEASDGEGGSNNAVWRWVDQHGEKYGIFRPMKGIDPAHIQPTGDWHDVAFNIRDKHNTADGGYLTASVDGGGKAQTLVDSPAGVSESQFDCVRSHHHADFRLAGFSHRHGFIGRRSVMMHPGRMHRFGRRRMVVDGGMPNRRADADTLQVIDQTVADAKLADTGNIGKHAKAEASARNRRDARREKMADGGPAEKHPAHDDPVNSGRAQRDTKTSQVKAPQAKAQHDKAAAVKPPKAADDRHSQKRAVEAPAPQAKAKDGPGHHVAERQDASDKTGNKKL
jgi:hypothetical protein